MNGVLATTTHKVIAIGSHHRKNPSMCFPWGAVGPRRCLCRSVHDLNQELAVNTLQPNKFLQGALLADAVVSGAVALLQLALTGPLVDLLHLPSSLLLGTGTFLVAYGALLVVVARSARVWTPLMWIVVVGNMAWALACIGLILGATAKPSSLGVAFVGVQAVAVLIFASLEYKGLVESVRSSRTVGARA
jgi:hypothetical protein